MKTPSIVEMLQAGVHFGHTTSRWHPKMKPFIYTQRNGIHVIDLQKTQEQLADVLTAVREMTAQGKKILFVTTKPQAREVVKEAAMRAGQPYLVDRWVGGLLTNFSEIKKLIVTYNKLKNEQATGELEKYTKKERLEISRDLEKKDEVLGGLKDLTKMPDVIFIPAVQKEKTAVVEAQKVGVPIVGVCDTNANPDVADYVIPGNDDAVKSISLMVNLVADAAAEGVAEHAKKAAQAPAPEAKK